MFFLCIKWASLAFITASRLLRMSSSVACEQALLFGRAKGVSRERASERRSRLAQVGLEERRWFMSSVIDLENNADPFWTTSNSEIPLLSPYISIKLDIKKNNVLLRFYSFLDFFIALPFYDFLQFMQNPWKNLSVRRMFIYWEREVVSFTLFHKLVQRVEDLKRYGNSIVTKGSRNTSKNWMPEERGLAENHYFIIGDAYFTFVNCLCYF